MKKTALQKGFLITYLLLLGLCVGAELTVGALVAPVIFFPTQFLGDGVLNHFQSGILMTQIFLRFDILLMISSLLMVAYEIYAYSVKNQDLLSVLLLFVVLAGSLAFVLYFTPYIVEAQKLGAEATNTDKFRSMHRLSEIVIKAVVIGQIALFFRRVWRELR